MLTLPNSTLDKLQLITAQNGAKVLVAYNDDDGTGAYPGGSQKTTIASATTTDICATPGVGSPLPAEVREVHAVIIKNNYAGAHAVTVQQVSGGNTYELLTVTLAQNETLQYSHGDGWSTINASAARKVAMGGAIAADTLAVSGASTFSGPVTLTDSLTVATGVITTSEPVAITQEWNAGGVTFTAFDLNITDSASAAGSLLANLRVGGASKFSVNKAGDGVLAGDIAINGGDLTTSAITFNLLASPTTVNAFAGASVALNIGHASAAAAAVGGILIPTGKNVTGAGTATVTGFATVSATTLTGTLSTAAQPNITSVGTLTSLTVSGRINANLPGDNIRLKADGTDAKDASVSVSGLGIVSVGHWAAAEINISTTGAVSLGSNSLTAGAISGTTGAFSDIVTLTAAVQPRLTFVKTNATAQTYDIYNNGNLVFFDVTGGSIYMALSSTGLAVAGTLSATGQVTASVGAFFGATVTTAALVSQATSGAGTTTHYIGNQTITTSSDIRLKANVVDSQRDAVAIIDKLHIVDHTWDDPSDESPYNRNSRGVWTGLIAQEAVKHIPWLVNKPPSDTGEDGKPQYWFMDYGYAVPLVFKAVQQLDRRVKALEAKLP